MATAFGSTGFEFTEGSTDAIYFEDKQTVFGVDLTIKTTSADIITGVQYMGGTASETPYTETVSVDGIETGNKLKVAVASVDGTVNPSVYTLSVNGTAVSTVNEWIEIPVEADGAVTVPVKAEVKPEYKSGKLHIDVKRDNAILENKIISINEVKAEFGTYSIVDPAGPAYTVSSDNNGIDITYKYAQDVTLTVTDATDYAGKYAFNIGSQEKVGKGIATTPIELDGTTTQSIVIEPVQVKFDTTVNATITSNNKIAAFEYQFNTESPATYTISQNTVSFSKENATAITLTNFSPADGVDSDSYYLVIKANGKEVKEVTPGSGTYTISITGDSVDVSITAEPKNAITLSFNKCIDDFDTSDINRYVDGKDEGALSFDGNGSSKFYTRTGAAIKIDKIEGNSSHRYSFADVANAELSDDGDYWELGKATGDKTFLVNKVQFPLSSNKVLQLTGNYAVTVSFDDTRMGSGAEEKVDGYWLFADNSASDLKVAFDVTESTGEDEQYTYEVKSVKYTDAEGTLSSCVISGSGDEYTASVPKDDAMALFLAGKALVLKADVNKNTEYYHFSSTVDPSSGGTIEAYVQGKEVSSVVQYGANVKVFATPKPGFTLKSVSINEAASKKKSLSVNTIVPVDEKDLNKFLTTGYDYEMGKGAEFIFVFAKEYSVNVDSNDSGSNPFTPDKKGVYQLIYNKPVYVNYRYGDENVSGFDYEVLLNGKKTTSEDKIDDYIKKVPGKSSLEVDGKGFQGKKVTITLFKRISENKIEDASSKKVELKFDSAASKSVAFAKKQENVARGGKVKLALKVKGIYEFSAPTVSGADANGPFASWTDSSNPEILVTTNAATKTGEYIVNVWDDNDTSAPVATTKITVKDVVKDGAAPNAAVTMTTNTALYLNLTANKLDTTLDGLKFKVKVTPHDVTDTAFVTTFTDILLPIDTAMPYKLSLIKPDSELTPQQKAAKEFLSAGEKANYDIEVSIVQGESSTAVNTKIKGQTVKPGGIFASKIKLKRTKDSASKLYSNADKDNAYKVAVDFGKDTSVCMLDGYDLTDENGNSKKAYLKYDEASFVFTIVGEDKDNGFTALDPGNYVLTAHALETNGVDVSASIKIKVLQAVESLALDSTKTIYKLAGKKATATVKAFDTTDNGYKAAKKIIWTMVKHDDVTKEVAFDGVTLKNGKITIAKDVIPKNIQFKVKAQANDYKGNKVVAYSEVITVADKPSGKYEIAFSKDGVNFEELKGDKTVAEMFGNGDGYGYEYVTYLMLREKEGNKANIPADIKVSGGAKLISTKTDTINGEKVTYSVFGFTKTGKLKIQAASTDGSERKLSGKDAVALELKSSTGKIGWKIAQLNASNISKKGTAEEAPATLQCNVANGASLDIEVVGCDTEGNQTFINHKISVKGAKLVKTKNVLDRYVIIPNSSDVEIKLTNVATKNAFTIKLSNKAIAGKSVKTKTSVKATSFADKKNGKKIYSAIDFSKVTAADVAKGFKDYTSENKVNNVEYTVTPATATKVLVSVVKDDATHNNPIDMAVNTAAGGNKLNGGAYIIPLVSGNFAIDYSKDKKFDIKPGSYKINVTAVNDSFEALGKPVDVTVQAVKAPRAKVQINKAVDFGNGGTVSQAQIKIKSPGVYGKDVLTPVIVEGELKNALFKNTGASNMNNFRTNFKFDGEKGVNGYSYLKFWGAKDIDPKSKNAAEKAEFSGWIPYTYQSLDGTIVNTYVKVDIKAKTALKGIVTTP